MKKKDQRKPDNANDFGPFCIFELMFWCNSFAELMSLDVPQILLKTKS